VVNQKAAGKEITTIEEAGRPAEVIDLMEALKASLAKGPAKEKKAPAKARRAEPATPSRKVNALRK
jgi:non-homologous end joining protein Ku